MGTTRLLGIRSVDGHGRTKGASIHRTDDSARWQKTQQQRNSVGERKKGGKSVRCGAQDVPPARESPRERTVGEGSLGAHKHLELREPSARGFDTEMITPKLAINTRTYQVRCKFLYWWYWIDIININSNLDVRVQQAASQQQQQQCKPEIFYSLEMRENCELSIRKLISNRALEGRRTPPPPELSTGYSPLRRGAAPVAAEKYQRLSQAFQYVWDVWMSD